MTTTVIIGSGRTRTGHTLPFASNSRPSHTRQQEDLADVGYQSEDGAGFSVLRPAVPVQMLRRFSRLAYTQLPRPMSQNTQQRHFALPDVQEWAVNHLLDWMRHNNPRRAAPDSIPPPSPEHATFEGLLTLLWSCRQLKIQPVRSDEAIRAALLRLMYERPLTAPESSYIVEFAEDGLEDKKNYDGLKRVDLELLDRMCQSRKAHYNSRRIPRARNLELDVCYKRYPGLWAMFERVKASRRQAWNGRQRARQAGQQQDGRAPARSARGGRV